MGIPLRRGRWFTPHDDSAGRPVTVVDEVRAQSACAREDPTGKRLRIFGREVEVVGVVGHVKHHGLVGDDTARVRSQLYMPHRQLPDLLASLAGAAVTVVVKSPLPTSSLMGLIRRALRDSDLTQGLVDARRMDEVVDRSLAGRHLSLVVLGMFATIALLLSLVGIYGVVAHLVEQRTREFGVRLALGASARELLREVFGYGSRLAVTGTTIGIGCALAASGLVRSQLYEVSATIRRPSRSSPVCCWE